MPPAVLPHADVVITGGTIVDGGGGDGYPGWVAVVGERISGVGPSTAEAPRADRVIDATGNVVAPGFIDPHQHSDCSPMVTPWMESFLRQGVTTAISGNCGMAAWPGSEAARETIAATGVRDGESPTWSTAAEFFSALAAAAPAINVASLAGHGSIRASVMGRDDREPSHEELSAMQQEVAASIEAGALGLSTGLIYAPGFHARTEELVALAEVMRSSGAPYVSHMRSEGVGVFDAIDEAVSIGRDAGVPVHISHLKLDIPRMWGRTAELFSAIDHARETGVEVTADQYPYAAYETSLEAFLPPWAPVARLSEFLQADRARLRRAVLEGDGDWGSSVLDVGWERVAIGDHRQAEYTGRTIAAIAQARGDADPFDTFCVILAEDPTCGVVGHSMDEADVAAIRASPSIMVGSDGIATSPEGPLGHIRVHPRYYGTFPRVLGRFVREQGLVSLGQAMAAMTSLVADRFGLEGRGRIQDHAFADLVIFDERRIIDTATFEDPHRYPTGIDAVMVNGRLAWSEAEGFGERAGRVLRRS